MVVDGIIMITPTIGYVDTFRIMVKTKKSDNYNINTVLIIFFGQGIKVMYYCYHPYATRVFGQTLSLLISAMALTVLKYKYPTTGQIQADDRMNENQIEGERTIEHNNNKPFIVRLYDIYHKDTLFGFCVSLFSIYLTVYAAFCVASLIVGINLAVETLGLIANLLEATTSFPTFVRVVIRKDIMTVSPILVGQYLVGDIIKILIFVLSKTPWHFIFGAGCQLTIDYISGFTYFRMSRRLDDNVDEDLSLIQNQMSSPDLKDGSLFEEDEEENEAKE